MSDQSGNKEPRVDFKNFDIGLLKFCLQHGFKGDSSASTQPERDKADFEWLREAFDSLEDDVKRMIKLIGKLQDPSLSEEELCNTLDDLEFYIEESHNANDLPKINGVTPIVSLLKHEKQRIKTAAASIIATASSNNPPAQTAFLAAGALPLLIDIVRGNQDSQPVTRAMTAISAIVRGSDEGTKLFLDANGISLLLDLLQDSSISGIRMRSLLILKHIVRTKADAEVIKPLSSPQTFATFKKSLRDQVPDNREKAAELLLELGSKSPSFLRMMKNSDLPREVQALSRTEKDSVSFADTLTALQKLLSS